MPTNINVNDPPGERPEPPAAPPRPPGDNELQVTQALIKKGVQTGKGYMHAMICVYLHRRINDALAKAGPAGYRGPLWEEAVTLKSALEDIERMI